MALHPFEAFERRTLGRQQAVADALEMLGDDVKPGIWQEMVDVGDAPRHRVLDGQHGERRPALAHRRDHVLEAGAGQRRQLREDLAAGEVGISPRCALEGDEAGPI